MSFEITLLVKAGGPLTKRISLDADGNVKSDGSACIMSRGTAQRFSFDHPQEFAALIERLRPAEAIALGRLRDGLPDMVRVVTKRELDTQPDCIARVKESISYRDNAPALALIDFDMKGLPEHVAQRMADLGGVWAALKSVLPALEHAPRVTRASTSAGLYNRRYQFENYVPLVDLGLRLSDVERMSLESEPVVIEGSWSKRAATLERHGATDAEIAFLRNRRVELNAMTSRQIMDFIEAGFAQHAVTKVIPDAEAIGRQARNVVENKFMEEALKQVSTKIAERVKAFVLPADLRQRIQELLNENPRLSWDEAVSLTSFAVTSNRACLNQSSNGFPSSVEVCRARNVGYECSAAVMPLGLPLRVRAIGLNSGMSAAAASMFSITNPPSGMGAKKER
jgi:hypothetical protein